MLEVEVARRRQMCITAVVLQMVLYSALRGCIATICFQNTTVLHLMNVLIRALFPEMH